MIDIHTHLIPDIDDGAQDQEETTQILKKAVEDGITEIVLTPHYLLPNHNPEFVERIRTGFNRISEWVQNSKLDIKLYYGAELFLQGNLVPLIEDPNLRLNKTCYYLLELPMSSLPNKELLWKNLIDIRDKTNYTPILAHPERNIDVRLNPELLFSFVDFGVLIQLNAGSIIGNFGSKVRKTAKVFSKKAPRAWTLQR